MKDEKFCFKKSTGFIALVGILLVGFVLFAQMSNQQTSLGSKAAPPAVTCTYGTKNVENAAAFTPGTYTEKTTVYTYDPVTFCITELVYLPSTGLDTTKLTGARCRFNDDGTARTLVKGGAVNDANCKPTPTPGAFSYMGNVLPWTDASGKEYKVDSNNCLLYNNIKTGLVGNTTTFRYNTAPAGSTCAVSPVSRTDFTYMGNVLPWKDANGKEFSVDGSNCLLYDAKKTGLVGDSTNYTFSTAAVGTTCSTVPADSCWYGGEQVNDAAGDYMMDANFCVLKAGAKNGYRCPTTGTGTAMKVASGKNSAYQDKTKCEPATTATPRTSCVLNGVALSDAGSTGTVTTPTYGTAVEIKGVKYALESPTDCVVYSDRANLNTGYWCDRTNGFKMLYNTTKCPVN